MCSLPHVDPSVVSDSATPQTSSPGSSVHGVLQQAKILEWVAISFSSSVSYYGLNMHFLLGSDVKHFFQVLIR